MSALGERVVVQDESEPALESLAAVAAAPQLVPEKANARKKSPGVEPRGVRLRYENHIWSLGQGCMDRPKHARLLDSAASSRVANVPHVQLRPRRMVWNAQAAACF